MVHVIRIARENPVPGAGNQHNGRIDGIFGIRLAEQQAR